MNVLDKIFNLADYVAMRYYYRPISPQLLEEVKLDLEELLMRAGYLDLEVRVSAIDNELHVHFVPEYAFSIREISLDLEDVLEDERRGEY